MTLTELKYIVAVARERHFGRAAEACFVSQPTLSVAIKKLEEELDVKLFERGSTEVSVTPLGEDIVRQAQSVIEQAAAIKEIAKRGKDPGQRPAACRHHLHDRAVPAARPGAPGHRAGAADAADPAGELHRPAARHAAHGRARLRGDGRTLPRHRAGDGAAVRRALFQAAVPARTTRWPSARAITAEELKNETMLLLGTGHCFRDHVLEVCPEYARFCQRHRGHPQELRGQQPGDHQVHGGQRHGRDGGAAASACRPRRSRTSATSASARRRRPAAWYWRGGAASPATRPSRRCATASMPARVPGVWRLS